MVENFDDPFEAWETNFMGTESNLANYYVISSGNPITYRGNNPDGLWLDDGDGAYGTDTVDIAFNFAFGSTLTEISFLLSTFAAGIVLEFYDIDGNTLSTSGVTQDSLYTPVISYGATSGNGIGGFRLTSLNTSQIEGNTSIDAISVTIDDVNVVPLPASGLLLVGGLAALGLGRRRKS